MPDSNRVYQIALTSHFGEELLGHHHPVAGWDPEVVEIFRRIVTMAKDDPIVAMEWQLGIAFLEAEAGGGAGGGADGPVISLIDDVVFEIDKQKAGSILFNLLILTEPSVYSYQGDDGLTGQKRRMQQRMIRFFDSYRDRLAYAAETPIARDALRQDLVTRANHPHAQGDSEMAMARLFRRACALHPLVCDHEESPAFAAAVGEYLATLPEADL